MNTIQLNSIQSNPEFNSIRLFLPFVAGGARSYIQETNQTVGNQQQPQSHIQFHFGRIALEDLFVDDPYRRFLYSTAIPVSQYQ